MKRGVLYTLLSVAIGILFIAPLAYASMPDIGPQHNLIAEGEDSVQKPKLIIHDSLRATYKYTDALKALTIHSDTTKGLPLLHEALEIDSTFAPAHYELASHYLQSNPQRAILHARKAYDRDTTSRWYAALYGQSLAIAGEVDKALPIYRKLIVMDKNNPDHYRILAILYQQHQQPFSALATLDSAEVRFGKIGQLSSLKRMLLIRTNQMDRAIEEAQQAVEEAPYEVENVISLGHTYASAGRDSLARETLRSAIRMDSTSIDALTTYADFCSRKNDVRDYLSTLKLLMAQPAYPVQKKSDICHKLTSDRNFYGQNYMAIGSILHTFVIHHSSDKRAIDLYGDHLLAGGEFEPALEFFKLQLKSEPPQMDYYMAVIDLEEYLQHPDSVDYYVQQAMQRFPENPTLHIRKANRLYIKGNLHGAIESFHTSLSMAKNDTLRGELWGYIGDTYHAMAEEKVRRKEAKKEARLIEKEVKQIIREGKKTDSKEKLSEEEKQRADRALDSMIATLPEQYPIRISEKKAMKLCYESYEKSLSLYPDNAMTLNNYAYFLSLERQQLEKALAMSSRAIILSPNNATYLDTHAWVLYELGRYEEARNVMRKALMLDSEGSEALMMHYGDILYAMKEYFMAETYWQKALEAGADRGEVEKRLQMLKSKSEE